MDTDRTVGYRTTPHLLTQYHDNEPWSTPDAQLTIPCQHCFVPKYPALWTGNWSIEARDVLTGCEKLCSFCLLLAQIVFQSPCWCQRRKGNERKCMVKQVRGQIARQNSDSRIQWVDITSTINITWQCATTSSEVCCAQGRCPNFRAQTFPDSDHRIELVADEVSTASWQGRREFVPLVGLRSLFRLGNEV